MHFTTEEKIEILKESGIYDQTEEIADILTTMTFKQMDYLIEALLIIAKRKPQA